MSLHRFFLPQPLASGLDVEVDGERAHYLTRVLRLRAGSELTVFTGGGDDYAAVITSARRDRLVLRVGEATRNDNESPLAVRLVQGVSRGERMDFAVQKATELGVQQILPVLTDFSVVKLNAERAERRMRHWQKIAQGACEQCGRNRVPTVNLPVALDDYLGRTADSDRRIVLAPGAATTLQRIDGSPRSLDILVGPEGGLSEREIRDAANSGFCEISVGPRILRSETAALTAITLAQAKWGDL